MLIRRIIEPKPEDIFYHYCSVETFTAICEHKKVRLGDANIMNDYSEGRWGYRVFELAATEILNDQTIQEAFPGLDKGFFDKVDEIISPMQLAMHPVISSFSKEPDVLSQWRAYADNGRGFAIGLSGAVLKAMPVTLLEVEYDHKAQIDEMKAALIATHMRNIELDNRFEAKFREDCLLIGAWKLGFKNPAFAEEKEVRCLHVLDVCTDDDRPRLVDAGGFSGKQEIKGEKVNYRVKDDAIVAYVDITIPELEGKPLINEVWMGPRNVNGPGNIVYFLSECGLKGYSVHRSAATYR